MRIGVVGAGGAGGHFAARWAVDGHDVIVVARGAHGSAIAEEGLTLLSPLGDAHARPATVSNVSDLAELDCLVFATKSFQLEEAAAAAAGIPAPFVTFGVQNGVTAKEVLRERLPNATVLGGTCRVISMIESPGVIRHVGADPTIIIGGDDGVSGQAAEDLARELSVPGLLTVQASDRIDEEIWRKFLWFAPVSGVGSVSGLSIGAFRRDDEWRGLLLDAMGEVATIASAFGVSMDRDDVERALAFVDTLPASGTSSLQRDIEAGRPNELGELSGRVVQLGRELGIETPANSSIIERLGADETG